MGCTAQTWKLVHEAIRLQPHETGGPHACICEASIGPSTTPRSRGIHRPAFARLPNFRRSDVACRLPTLCLSVLVLGRRFFSDCRGLVPQMRTALVLQSTRLLEKVQEDFLKLWCFRAHASNLLVYKQKPSVATDHTIPWCLEHMSE